MADARGRKQPSADGSKGPKPDDCHGCSGEFPLAFWSDFREDRLADVTVEGDHGPWNRGPPYGLLRLTRKHVDHGEVLPQSTDARAHVIALRRPENQVGELPHLALLRPHSCDLVRPDPGDGVHDDVVLLENDGPVVRVRVPSLHQAGLEEVDLVALRVSAMGELDREVALLELTPERLRVPHDLFRVRLSEGLHLEEGLRRRCDPVPVRVVRHPPCEVLPHSRKEVFAVRHDESTLWAEERLVRAAEEDVCALPERVLELPAGDEPEDVAPIVGEEGSDLVTRLPKRPEVVGEHDEAPAEEDELRLP